MALPDTAAELFEKLRARARSQPRRIVFPEGDDPRIRQAAARLEAEGLAKTIRIGSSEGAIDPVTSPSLRKYAAIYYDRRRAKGTTEMEALEMAKRPLYFAALMVAAGDADGTVGGAANTTAETVRAALHAIGTRAGIRLVSSYFLIAARTRDYGHNGLLLFADCAVNIDPPPVDLAEIAIATAESARTLLGVEPSLALLSFSTKGSADHKEVDQVKEALRIVRERAPGLQIDGELQVDAALVPSVGQSKAPGSAVAGLANTLIFPNLASANIGYKLVERLGGAAAIGPFLQGLARPANDLSRGCSADDVYHAAIVTAVSA